MQHGFDDYFGLPYSNDMWPYHPGVLHLPMEQRHKRWTHLPLIDGNAIINPRVTGIDQEQLTTQYTERAVSFIEKNKERPFFLYVPHSMVHVPLYVSEKFKGKSKAGLFGDVMMEVDWSVGKILDTLRKHKLDKNTLVIFMGDNGEALLRGKGTLFDRGTHVPLLIRWPRRVKPGSSSSALVCGTDLGSTILAACGMKQLKEMTGVSFLRQLLGGQAEGRQYVFSERGWHWGPLTRTDGLDLSRSITTKRYRYIYNALPTRSYKQVDMSGKDAWKAIQSAYAAGRLSPLHERLFFQNPRPIVELYDLRNDPSELNNLAGKKSVAEIERTLREQLESWMIREHDYLPLPTHALQNTK